MSHAIQNQRTTIRDFDAFLEAQRDDSIWELIDGEIVLQSNPSERHEQIVANIGAPLKRAMDPIGCRVYMGGMRVQRSEDARGLNKPKPDVLVRCGRVSSANFVTDPLVVVEVLSPSTMDNDRGEKLRFYKTLPTLRHIVLVYQDQVRVEHYRRTDTRWEPEILRSPGEFLALEAIDTQIPLETVYFDVDVTPQ